MVVKKKKSDRGFDPSMKTLSRIMTVLAKNDSEGKTQLSVETHLHYTRLAKHIVWLEKKGLVESKVKGSKINVTLTGRGKVFASILSKDYNNKKTG
jgi:predicted transcriptional regulator